MLANDTEMADAVDSNGDTMHNFLEEQMYFGGLLRELKLDLTCLMMCKVVW